MTQSDSIRNVVFASYVGAGKTSLVEAGHSRRDELECQFNVNPLRAKAVKFTMDSRRN